MCGPRTGGGAFCQVSRGALRGGHHGGASRARGEAEVPRVSNGSLPTYYRLASDGETDRWCGFRKDSRGKDRGECIGHKWSGGTRSSRGDQG